LLKLKKNKTDLSPLDLYGEYAEVPKDLVPGLRQSRQLLCGLYRDVEGYLDRVPWLALGNIQLF